LAEAIVGWIDWPKVRAVAEYGAGTGVFTELIRTRVQPGARFFAMDTNPHFVATIQRRLPDIRVYCEDVKNVALLCAQEGIGQLDAIICGLPWASFSNEQQTDLLDATSRVLAARGQFATFAYLQGVLLPSGQRFRRKLRSYFRETTTSSIVWRNVPPAFVYQCRK
jgi:phospholipid N-methyltransferase